MEELAYVRRYFCNYLQCTDPAHLTSHNLWAMKNLKWMIGHLHFYDVGSTPLLQSIKSWGCDKVFPSEGFRTLQREETAEYEQWWNDD